MTYFTLHQPPHPLPINNDQSLIFVNVDTVHQNSSHENIWQIKKSWKKSDEVLNSRNSNFGLRFNCRCCRRRVLKLPWTHVFLGLIFFFYLVGACRSAVPRLSTSSSSTWSSRSALVNIRRKALLSSVGFRKRMTSRSPRRSPCDSCKFRFDRPLWFVWWSDVCFAVLSCFFDHSSIDSTKKMPLHLFGKDVLMFRLDQAS